MPGRNYSSGSYRYLFQGQEHDDEINDAAGTSYAFTYRMHDARVGRFWSIDPLAAKYPWNSPYAFAENKVIKFIELEGLETARNYGDFQGERGTDWGIVPGGAWGANEATNWRGEVNGKEFEIFTCPDCTGLTGRRDENPLMFQFTPTAQDPLPSGNPGSADDPVGGNAPMDQPALQVPNAGDGGPTPPPVSRPKPKPPAPHKNQFLPLDVPIYADGNMLSRNDPMAADVYGPIDNMINAINANAGQYTAISLSVQIGMGNNYNTERAFSERGYSQLHGYIRSRLDPSIQIQRGSVRPANGSQRAVPGSSVAIFLH